jgi:chemotaxis protein histidine kinase CheA/ActR/RegA family two-component response regulator
MQLNDYLQVLRAEFAQSADGVDAELAAWTETAPDADPAPHAEALVASFDQLAEVSRMVGLEGQALVVEQLRDMVQLCAMSDADSAQAGLAWLSMWREPLGGCYERPGDDESVQLLLDYLALSPMPLDPELREPLREWLMRAPRGPEDGSAAAIERLPEPSAADVSLNVPEDVDAELLDTFLAQAPDQLAVLAEAVQALVDGRVAADLLAEARRVAHTFKGSGQIIGIRGVASLAHRLEDLLDLAQAQSGQLPPAMALDLQRATLTLEQMVGALRGDEAEPPDAWAVLRALTQWARHVQEGAMPVQVDPAPATSPGQAPRPLTVVDVDLPGAQPGDATPAAAASPPEPARATPAAEPASQLRVDASRLEQLTRRAGQQLVDHARLGERLRLIDQRLLSLQDTQRTLEQRIGELQSRIDQQRVALHEGAAAAEQDSGFDRLEKDRFSEVHSLVRLAAEMVADGSELAQAARAELHEAGEQHAQAEQRLKLQHTQLLDTRLVPFRQIAARLQRMVQQTALATGKSVQLQLEGDQTRLDLQVLERLTEPLLHLLRNAVDHGIESSPLRQAAGKPELGCIRLHVHRAAAMLRIDCHDDGAGLDLRAIHAKALRLGLVDSPAQPDEQELARWILLPGFSTRDTVSDISGRGLGLDVVAERVRQMKGQVDIVTRRGEGSCFTLHVPATTGLAHALVVRAGAELYALPTPAVVTALPAVALQEIGGQLHCEGRHWPSVPLARLVGRAEDTGGEHDTPGSAQPATRPAVVVRLGRQVVALRVDAVLEARELLLQDIGSLLAAAPGVAGGALRPDGRVVFLLDLPALEPASPGALNAEAARHLRERAQRVRRRALVVDDSHSVRRLLMQTLVDAGWEAIGARDGFDALDQLARERVDIVLTDLEMPQLDGLEMTRELRSRPEGRALPVLMITSRDSAKHRQRAREAGVSRYLTKPVTDEGLMSAVRELLAGPAPAA